MTEANREACAEATKPLINSVESLTAYALSPEFAPLPAKISEEVGAGICLIPVKALQSHRKVMRNLNRLKTCKFFVLILCIWQTQYKRSIRQYLMFNMFASSDYLRL